MAKGTRIPKPKQQQPLPGSLGEALEEAGFQDLGRRIIVGQGVEKSTAPPAWVGEVVNYFEETIPSAPDGGWEHLNIGAYEVACQALIALGHATEVVGGAKPVAKPTLPRILPRLDDIATATVWLSSQSGLLSYRQFAGIRTGPTAAGLLRPNVRAAHGSGPAYLAAIAAPVFQSLGLVIGGRWTERAEKILWRDYPEEWGIDFSEDPRFIAACDAAVKNVPSDIRQEIREQANIPEKDIVEWLATAERYAPTPKTREDALRSLRIWRRMWIDGVFAKRWRLDGGWLSLEESQRALHFRFDPVALHMRHAFASRSLQEFPFLYE
jgi:hypothetical protein